MSNSKYADLHRFRRKDNWAVAALLPEYGFECALHWRWEQPLSAGEQERSGWSAYVNDSWAFWHPELHLMVRLDGHYHHPNSVRLSGFTRWGVCPEKLLGRIAQDYRHDDPMELAHWWLGDTWQYGLDCYRAADGEWAKVSLDVRDGVQRPIQVLRRLTYPAPYWPVWPGCLDLLSWAEEKELASRYSPNPQRIYCQGDLTEHYFLCRHVQTLTRWVMFPASVRAVMGAPPPPRASAARHRYCRIESNVCVAAQHEAEARAVLQCLED